MIEDANESYATTMPGWRPAGEGVKPQEDAIRVTKKKISAKAPLGKNRLRHCTPK